MMVFSLFLFSPSIDAQYLDNGSLVSTAPSGQWVEDITTDGAEGAILVWEDWRGTSIDIYAQRLNERGYAQWTIDGIVICGASGQQQYPRLIPDGSGGAFITWSDSRSGSYVAYAQRIDADGNSLWTAGGVPLSNWEGWQQYPVLVPDGTGGTIIFWQAGIGSAADIYAQRVDAGGAVQWSATGSAVCTAAGMQSVFRAIPDGHGGAMISWTDHRGSADNIFAQRIDSGGAALWTVDGVAICIALRDQRNAGIVDDGDGGAIIAWTDYRNDTSWEMYAQRVDPLGSVQWTANGEYIPSRPGDATDLGIASDGGGGAYIAWIAAGASDSLFAGRIDADGATLWTAPLSPAGTGSVSILVSDGAGAAIISWETSGDIYGQKIDSDGIVAWSEGGVAICSATDAQQYPVATSDGSGGIIASWWDYRNSGGSAFEGDVYAGRIDANGDIVATLLESFTASLGSNAIVIRWTLSLIDDGTQFIVLRAETPGGDFAPIAEPEIERVGLSFQFSDSNCRPGATYRYRIDVVDDDGRAVLFETDAISVPAASAILHQNHPNPFNPSTAITYVIPEDARVTLDIFDVEGKPVTRLVDTFQKHGQYTVRWNGIDRDGNRVDAGVYLYRFTAGKSRLSRKMVLLK